MSVINQMLQDLQARKVGLEHKPGPVMVVVPKPPGRRVTGLLLGGTALIAMITYTPWPDTSDASASRVPMPVLISRPAPVAVAASMAMAAKPSVHHAVLAKAPVLPNKSIKPVGPLLVEALLASAPTAAAPVVSGSVDKHMRDETPRQRAQTLYRQGADLAATGHVRQAVDLALDALKADPTYSEARQFAVSLLYEQQRLVEAEALARDGLSMSRQQSQLAYLLARMMADRGSNEAAVELLDQQTNLSPDGYGLRAGILSQAGNFKRASQDYQSAVMQQPDNSLWWLGLGVALEALGQSQEARRVYAKAQSLGMDRPDLTAFIDQKLKALN
jgi:MSHA biogenesis protein MshN